MFRSAVADWNVAPDRPARRRLAMRDNVLTINARVASYTASTRSDVHDDLQNSARYEIER